MKTNWGCPESIRKRAKISGMRMTALALKKRGFTLELSHMILTKKFMSPRVAERRTK